MNKIFFHGIVRLAGVCRLKYFIQIRNCSIMRCECVFVVKWQFTIHVVVYVASQLPATYVYLHLIPALCVRQSSSCLTKDDN